jgi:hypothetical protein
VGISERDVPSPSLPISACIDTLGASLGANIAYGPQLTPEEVFPCLSSNLGELAQVDFRILQHAIERGERGMLVSSNRASSLAMYRRLAEAGFLEHQLASMDTEWFGITDKGREALAQSKWT